VTYRSVALLDTGNAGALILSRPVKPVAEQVYPFSEVGEALRHLIEDRPFGKVVLAG
jgi:NADPH:quinone reductase